MVLGAATSGDERRIGTRDPHTLVIGRPSDAISLDPALPTDNESAEVIFQVYETLVEWEPGTSTVAPGLATSWEVDESGTVWTFELAHGVRFHDGTAFDADAVVFALERQRDPAHPYHRDDFQYWPNSFKNIQKVEKVDADTVRITIERPYSPFLANMAMFPVSIVSPAAVALHGADYGEHPVGTGPFVFVGWDKQERIVLRRNDDYWRRDRVPSLERLVFETIEDPRQRLIALESGAIDLAVSILPEELQFVELHPGLVLHETPANNVAYLAMNMDDPTLASIEVRRAISHAINKDAIVQLAFGRTATPASSPLPPGMWSYHKPRATYPYDPAAARQLLAQAQAAGAWDPATVLTFYAPSTVFDGRVRLCASGRCEIIPDDCGVGRARRGDVDELEGRAKGRALRSLPYVFDQSSLARPFRVNTRSCRSTADLFENFFGGGRDDRGHGDGSVGPPSGGGDDGDNGEGGGTID
jgi:peptide/nickel transport system substrate-binding protein